jgi:hypothetical protein
MPSACAARSTSTGALSLKGASNVDTPAGVDRIIVAVMGLPSRAPVPPGFVAPLS